MQGTSSLFITDPIESLNPKKDTTVLWMQEVSNMGGKVLQCEIKDLFFKDQQTFTKFSEIKDPNNHPQTAELVNDKKIDGISEIRDESDRKGMRIVYELKRDSIPNVVLNKLYKYTALQSSFSVNNIALVKDRPELLNLRDMIVNFVEHRHEVVVRRTQFELGKAEERAHILEGLIIALDNIDAVINLIRASKSPEEARNGLMEKFELSEVQAKAILDMRLQKLTGLERDKLRAEYDELMELIADLKDILDRVERRMEIIKTELIDVKERFGDERRSTIEYSSADLSIEDMIPDEQVVVTISHAGYIKRTALDTYRTQR